MKYGFGVDLGGTTVKIAHELIECPYSQYVV